MNINVETVEWDVIEKELESHFSSRFRKMRIGYSRLGSVCIIAFPHGFGDYQIFTRSKMTDFSFKNIKSLVV